MFIEGINKKISHIVTLLSVKGFFFIGLGIFTFYYPQIIQYIFILVMVLLGLVSLFIAGKVNAIRKTAMKKMPSFLK